MFDEERETLEKLYKYFETRFGEEVGVMAGAVESEEFELDLIVGLDSDIVRGIRFLQFLPSEDVGGEEESEGGEEEGDDEAEGDEELYDVLVYDFVAREPGVTIEGDVLFEVKIATGGCCDEEGEGCDESHDHAPGEDGPFWISVKVFVKEDDEGAELTGIELVYLESGEKVVFLEDAFE